MQVRNQHGKLSPPDDETSGRYVATMIELHWAIKNARKRKDDIIFLRYIPRDSVLLLLLLL